MGDHIAGAGPIARKAKCPVFLPEETYTSDPERFAGVAVNFIKEGETRVVKTLEITAFSTKHDALGSVGFIVKDTVSGKIYGHLTDTGIVTPLIKLAMQQCHAFFIEADYDDISLEKNAEYSDELKMRITSPLGHLSNKQTIEYLKTWDYTKLQWVIVGHLSRKNNSPELLRTQLEAELTKEFNDKIHISFSRLDLEIK